MKKNIRFLYDVLMCSLGAYGGPEAHYGVFARRLVDQKQYLKESELFEYMALTSLLPGPSSTQTLMAIGYHVGGYTLAFLTLLVWAFPIGVGLSVAAYLYDRALLSPRVIEALEPLALMAIGFVFYAAYRMMMKGWKNALLIAIGLMSVLITLWLRSPWIFPLVLISSGAFYGLSQPKSTSTRVKRAQPFINWPLIAIFFTLVLGAFWATASDFNLFKLAGHFFQFGFLVIGGGQVVIPYMVETLVYDLSLLSLEDFLVGFGLVQGLPGPMFSFSAWAGGLSALPLEIPLGVAAWVSMASLFLPGTLLIFIMMPLWASIKEISFIKPALAGIIAGAAGVVLSTGITLMIESAPSLLDLGIIGGTFLLLLSKKIPAPWLVLGAILLSFLTL